MKIVVISGTPGTGKTTVSKMVSEINNAQVISLNQIALSEEYITKYDKKRETQVIDTDKLIQYLVELIKEFQQSNEELLIIEGHFADITPNEYFDIAIVLRCEPYELKKRLRGRDYPKEKIIENVQSEILGNCANYLLQKNLTIPIYELDTSTSSFDEISEKIIEIIDENKIDDDLLLGKVDWLEDLFQKDKMGDFFD